MTFKASLPRTDIRIDALSVTMEKIGGAIESRNDEAFMEWVRPFARIVSEGAVSPIGTDPEVVYHDLVTTASEYATALFGRRHLTGDVVDALLGMRYAELAHQNAVARYNRRAESRPGD